MGIVDWLRRLLGTGPPDNLPGHPHPDEERELPRGDDERGEEEEDDPTTYPLW